MIYILCETERGLYESAEEIKLMISSLVSNKMRRISYFATITIVMMHAGAYFEAANYIGAWNIKETLEHNLMGFMHYIGTISMSWFFFSTSFFFFVGYEVKGYREKIRKRIKSLLIPYLLWNLFMWGYNFLVYLRVGKVDVTFFSFFKSFIFFYWPGMKMWASINLPLWYIIRIFSYFLIAPVIYRVLRSKKIFVMSEIILIGAIFLFNINYYSFFYWLPMFLFGGYIAINKIQQFDSLFCKCHIYNPLRNAFAIVVYLLGGGYFICRKYKYKYSTICWDFFDNDVTIFLPA